MPKFVAAVDADVLDLTMYGQIGVNEDDPQNSISVAAVSAAMQRHPDASSIKVRLNSPGGDVFQALGIYEALKSSGKPVRMKIEGIAASGGSLIAMAGDDIEINSAGLFMMHRAKSAAKGDGDDLRKQADISDKIDASMVEVYSARSGQSPAEVEAMMRATTWLTAREARDKGFVTAISSAKTLTAEFDESEFGEVPASVLPILAALKFEARAEAVEAAVQIGSNQMSETTAQDNAAAATGPTPEQLRSQAIADERKRVSEITALCSQAGHSALAADFIDNGTEVEAVQKKLFTALCENKPPVNVGGGNDAPANKGPDAEFRAQYDEHKRACPKSKLTFEAFVDTVKFENGTDQLCFPRLVALDDQPGKFKYDFSYAE